MFILLDVMTGQTQLDELMELSVSENPQPHTPITTTPAETGELVIEATHTL